MKHDIFMAGHRFGLRPVETSDAEFIAALRADLALNRYIHAGDGDADLQRRWLRAYFERANDYYFVVESTRTRASEGLISVYDIDSAARVGEWGRWILRAGSLAAVESAWLIYKVCFEVLDLAAVYCRTVVNNDRVVSFHDSCGISRYRCLPGHFRLQGHQLDAIEHRVDREGWFALSSRLEKIARMVATRGSGV